MAASHEVQLSDGALPVLPAHQVREADRQTLISQGLSSLELMERAASRALEAVQRFIRPESEVAVVCGHGNNGGDGLVMARLLLASGHKVKAYLLHSSSLSLDCAANAARLREMSSDALLEFHPGESFSLLHADVVIDALFGTGLTRAVAGFAAEAIDAINRSGAYVISVDLPSGLPADGPLEERSVVVRARRTVTFQVPKLCFFFASSAAYVGEWTVIDIGLDLRSIPVSKYFVTPATIRNQLRPRPVFSHKGTFGHAWLAAGSAGMMGAAVLSSLACLKSGAGLLTVHVPRSGVDILQSTLPEALVLADSSADYFTGTREEELEAKTAAGAGPGLSQHAEVHEAVRSLLSLKIPLVLDADALNILSLHKEWLSEIPHNAILTPHPKEFERLNGKATDEFSRHQNQQAFSQRHKVVTVLKGAYTCTCLPGGTCYFNSTGNPAMATAGSGDVLTGIILALLAQGYDPAAAAVAGVFIHGLAGDLAVESSGPVGLLASEIAHHVPAAIGKLLDE